MRKALIGLAVLAALGTTVLISCGGGTPPPRQDVTLRLGHFPNVTHAQALIGRATGDFEKTIGVPVRWTQFNAGPSAVEALFASAIDAVYVGPNPAINGHIRSRGESFAIVAGAASGGAALVVRGDVHIASDADFHGKVVATPQLANTQDVAARLWFAERGLVSRDKGGDLTIMPLANPDQLLMFAKREIDAAWTVEPWVSRLEQEGGGRVYLEERDLWPGGRYPTAVLVVRREFLRNHPEVVKKLLTAHVEATQRLNADPETAARLISQEIKRETSAALPLPIVRSALRRVEFSWEPLPQALAKSAADAHRVGFLPSAPDLSGIWELAPLREVLREKGLPPLAEAVEGVPR
jgi:NitT/TauT family transport system substrate-binding protein